MDKQTFWKLIETARAQAEPDRVAQRAAALLAEHPAAEVAAAQQVLWDLLAESYRAPLWAAAYLINGGCSDDGFDYFRGWLLVQGEEVFTAALSDPDSLADHPRVRAASAGGEYLEDERALSIAWTAYESATGQTLPSGSFTITYPPLDPAWDFDFGDGAELTRRLPRLSGLFG
ncbi:DUF4240 domain-containing protein [Streptomyces sp. NBC_00335]|uniref:DUF4240 domain-containing protein n=1 Tax=unclassified Streptomyces TaxID=2593676 RepID=UPI00224C995A|nr:MULTISPECIES: DUF4240 domain-containing protein [unclassified Streptomyces]MCX5405874.1 DUF4240 domain-containing protein [Streptomyces sp. NBC_00086]